MNPFAPLLLGHGNINCKQSEAAMLEGSVILVTGGTGSFGTTFVKRTLARHDPKKIIVFSRDEMKQWEMARGYEHDERVEFLIGDVRDRERLYRALRGVDYVVHAAATKIVSTAEYNPFECIKTNVNGAMNLIDACIDRGIKKLVALSTDKASNPTSLYGASKLCSDKLFVAGNAYGGARSSAFSVVRYGNVMGSRGSVIPFFQSIKDTGVLPITDPRMTRFMNTPDQGVELVWHAFEDMVGGETYVKKISSMGIMEIARVIAPGARHKIIGRRPGEKLHEQMISREDAQFTYEYPEHFKILPAIHDWSRSAVRIKDGEPVAEDFVYASNTNPDWMSEGELSAWLSQQELGHSRETALH